MICNSEIQREGGGGQESQGRPLKEHFVFREERSGSYSLLEQKKK